MQGETQTMPRSEQCQWRTFSDSKEETVAEALREVSQPQELEGIM